MRKLYALHRWLGLSAGLMLFIWYGSGLYIHWRALPNVFSSEEQRRIAGVPFRLADAEKSLPEILLQHQNESITDIRLRRAGSRLVYELHAITGPVQVCDAQTGQRLSPISEEFAKEIAKGFLPDSALKGVTLLQEPDQYSMRLSMPVYRVVFSDHEGTTLYIDPNAASILSRTRTRERVYYVLGSIPHFLSFNLPVFRKHRMLQHGLLFALTIAAGMIVLSGLMIACWMLVQGRWLGGVGPPNSLMRKLHALCGLAFAITSFLFIASGFFYVLNGSPPPARIAPQPEEVKRIVQPIDPGRAGYLSVLWAEMVAADKTALYSTVRLRQLLGVPLVQLQKAGGGSVVLRADSGQPLVVDDRWLRWVAEAFLGLPLGPVHIRVLTEYDEYYYARDGRVPVLPVYRLEGTDPQKTFLYLSPSTGEVVGRASQGFRLFRWVVTGFHAWDWPFLLQRPRLRDAVVVFLVCGGLIFSLTGLYLGIMHLKQKPNLSDRSSIQT